MDIAIIYSILFALQGILIYLTHRTAYGAVRDLNILDHRQDFLAARLDSIDNRLDMLDSRFHLVIKLLEEREKPPAASVKKKVNTKKVK